MDGGKDQSQEEVPEGVARIDRYLVELSLLRVIIASAAVILVFAFLFPLVGLLLIPLLAPKLEDSMEPCSWIALASILG